MIRNEREYKEAISRLEKDGDVIEAQRQALAETGLSEEEVERALGPMFSFRAQLEEEVEWYEKVRRPRVCGLPRRQGHRPHAHSPEDRQRDEPERAGGEARCQRGPGLSRRAQRVSRYHHRASAEGA